MDRGAALNCRVVYNWDDSEAKSKKSKSSQNKEENTEIEEIVQESEKNE